MKQTKKLLTAIVFVLIAAVLLSVSAFAATGEASVNASALNMRTGGSMDFEVIDAAPRGATVYVTADDGNGWCQVNYNGKTGYMSAQYLCFAENSEAVTVAAPAQNAEPAAVGTAPSGNGNATIQGTYVRLRGGPSLTSNVLDYLHTGYGLQVNGSCGSWYEVVYNGMTGYVYADYVVLGGATYTVSAPASVVEEAPIYAEPVVATEEETYVPESVVETPVYAPVYNAAAGQSVVDTAMQFLGVPYVWAGTSPEEGFDCSGFVYYVYKLLGYDINRVAQAMYYNGTDVDLNDLQPGDILCFGDSVYNIWHVGIYIGNGEFVHSPHSGAVVSTQTIDGTYGIRLVAARRIV